MEAQIHVKDLTMIFGKDPKKEALPLFQQGATKEEILKQTRHVVGVANANFNVKQGEIFVIMGLSGSGKSTLIRCLNRLIEPTTGHVYIDDEDVLAADKQRLREIRRTRMAMVFQHFALLPHKTVWDNVAYGLKVRGMSKEERREKALESLELVGLRQWADHYPHNLSGGMKQRVGLARALATDPDILLMDEAFSALDPLIRRQMQNEMLNLQEKLQKTVVFITHDLNEALRVGNHIAVMRDGQIVQIGTPIQIVTEPADEYVAAFTRDVDYGRVLTAEVVMRPAETLPMGRDIVQVAAKRIHEMDHDSAVYVVDDHAKPSGMFIRDRFIEYLKDGKSGSNGDFSEYLESDFPRTSCDTSVADIYALVADGLPVAVLDPSGRLRGVIHAADILSNLAMVEQFGETNGESVTNGKSVTQ